MADDDVPMVNVYLCGYCGAEVIMDDPGDPYSQPFYVGLVSGRSRCPEGTVQFHEVPWSAKPVRQVPIEY